MLEEKKGKKREYHYLEENTDNSRRNGDWICREGTRKYDLEGANGDGGRKMLGAGGRRGKEKLSVL